MEDGYSSRSQLEQQDTMELYWSGVGDDKPAQREQGALRNITYLILVILAVGGLFSRHGLG